MHQRVRGLAVATTIATFVAHAEASAPAYTILDLTPDGYSSSVAYDINGHGDVVGLATRFVGESAETNYFIYDASTGLSETFGSGVVVPRGSIVETGFRMAAVNDHDRVAGTARFLGGASESRGFIWDRDTGTFTDLGTLPGATATGIRPASDALDINASNVAVGTATSGAGIIPGESDNIDIYVADGPPIGDLDLDLDTTVGTRGDFGRAINDAGLVAGRSSAKVAATFSGSTTTSILAGSAFAGTLSTAVDLNESGDVAGTLLTTSDAFVTDGGTGTVTILPQIGTGARMAARGINESGDVVGVGDRSASLSGEARGFVYDAGEADSFILEDRTIFTGSDTTGLSDWLLLRDAWAINDDGWIVGEGERRFTGSSFPNDRAYLLIPATPGDTDGDGDVDLADFGTLRSNFGLDVTGPGNADFDGDGTVTLADFGILRANFGSSSDLAVIDAWHATVIPEPSSMLAVIGFAGLTLRRRR
ncbi:MAG: DUF3466 family protein [Planctomycetota bacterium]